MPAAGLLLAAVLLAQEGAAFPAALPPRPSLPSVPVPGPGQAEVAPEVVEELRELFERLELGLRWGDVAVLRDCLDLDAMLGQAFEQGQRDLPGPERQAVLKEEFLARIGEESYPWTLWGLGRIQASVLEQLDRYSVG